MEISMRIKCIQIERANNDGPILTASQFGDNFYAASSALFSLTTLGSNPRKPSNQSC